MEILLVDDGWQWTPRWQLKDKSEYIVRNGANDLMVKSEWNRYAKIVNQKQF